MPTPLLRATDLAPRPEKLSSGGPAPPAYVLAMHDGPDFDFHATSFSVTTWQIDDARHLQTMLFLTGCGRKRSRVGRIGRRFCLRTLRIMPGGTANSVE